MTVKIVLVVSSISRVGGGVSEVARLHAAVLQKEAEIVVLTLQDDHLAEDRAAWGEVAIMSVKQIGPRSFGFAPALLGQLFRVSPDIVHVHGVWQFQCAAVHIWSLMTGKPYVVTPHGMLEPWIRARSKLLKFAVSSLYQDRFLRRAAAFQLLTTKEEEDVAEFRRGQPAVVIPNYVAEFKTVGERPDWWQDAFEGKDIYLFFGRIHEKKGCVELCDAWDKLCVEDEAFRRQSVLVFCGWNDGLLGFEDRVRSLASVHGNALFAGAQYGAQKQHSLATADFFVLPSKSEGLPMAILEAWSAGIPVLTTAEANLPIGFERNAALQLETDSKSIAATLKAASSMSGADRCAMSESAKSLVTEHFSAQGVRSSLVKLYELVLVRWGRS